MYFCLGTVVAYFRSSIWFWWRLSCHHPCYRRVAVFLSDKTWMRRQKAKASADVDFPSLSALTLLMNAGMHLRQSLEKIYVDVMERTPLYVELGTVLEDISAGTTESQAWQEFSERCKVREITSFASIISQNAKIGGSKMVDELKRMTHETWEMRKHAARQMGETAAAKLIFPLMLMFISILAIVVTPAVLQFSTGF